LKTEEELIKMSVLEESEGYLRKRKILGQEGRFGGKKRREE